jgi:GNAT superfamily N-acetyltransferase
MIRSATVEDIPRLVEMGKHFIAETEYSGKIKYRPEKLREFAEQQISNILVCVDGGLVTGMLAYLIYPHPYTGESTAVELFWWVEPEYRGQGIRLLRAVEQIAKDAGAKQIQMGAPNEWVGGIYKRLGYEQVETVYQRQL